MKERSEKPHHHGSQQIIIVPSEASIRTMQSSTMRALDNSKKVAKWRGYSRYVSYLDVVVTLAALIQGAVLIGLLSWIIHQTIQHDGYEELKLFSIVILTLCLIQFVLYIRGFWMACKLYSATNPSTLQSEAIEKAKRWRKYHIFKIFLTLFIGIITSTGGPTIGSWNFLWFILRVGFIFIVHKYICEMENNDEAAEEIAPKSAASVRPVMTIAIGETVPTTGNDGKARSSARSARSSAQSTRSKA